MKAANSAQSLWSPSLHRSRVPVAAGSARHRRSHRIARAVGLALQPHVEPMESRVLLSTTPGVYSGYILNTLGYFGSNSSGGNPRSALIADSKGNFYGTTAAGGIYGAGSVFEIASGTNQVTTLVSFNGVHGTYPYAGLTMDAAGDLFGTTYMGGTNNEGTVFEIAKGPYPVLTTLASFVGTNGEHPVGGVILDSSGNLFGTTDDGGPLITNSTQHWNDGTVYEIAQGSNTITMLTWFTGSPQGVHPNGTLAMDAAGNLYGTTYNGGTASDGKTATNFGTIFEVPAGTNTISTLFSFNQNNGSSPYDSLTFDGSGNLYGTTRSGGANGDGTVFELTGNTLSTLASFDGTHGANPYAGVTLDASGNIYGTTLAGGANSNGTVFEIAAASNTITTLASFSGTNGATPYGGVILDKSGNVYGTTNVGGDNGAGTVFEIPSGTNPISTLASFGGLQSALSPYVEGVTVDPAGNLYGMTANGGTFSQGSIYEIAAGTTTFTTLASFDGTDGALPTGVMAIDAKGNLFGTTSAGGDNQDGTVFELPSGSNTITLLASFNGTDGSSPAAGVTLDSSGSLFGTTADGGVNSVGTVFEVALGSKAITTLASFDPTKDGANPTTPVTLDSSGNIYGTVTGGPDPAGIVYEIFAGSGAITPVGTFSSDNGQYLNGQLPESGVIRDATGNLYGTAYMGGANNVGTVFEVPAGSNAATAIASFGVINGVNVGEYPHCLLTLDSSGNLYGTTSEGGGPDTTGTSYNAGTIFEISSSSSSGRTISTMASFNGSDGELPYTGMAMDAAGNFYGTTERGGVIGFGTVFELSTHSVVTLTPEPTTPNPAPASQALSYIVSLADAVPDGETVTIEDTSNGNVVVATGTLNSDTAVLTIPANTLSQGTHNLVAFYAGDPNFPPGQSLPYAQVIQGGVQATVTGVVINGDPGNSALAGVQRSMVRSIVYTFDQAVTLAATGAFTIAVHASEPGTLPTLNWAAINPDASGGSTQWVVTFSGNGTIGGSIGDGVYDITLNTTAVSVEGNPTGTVAARPTDTFYRLFGDVTGDGRVNNADYNQFLNTFNLKSGQTGYNAAFDASGTGSRIGNLDYNLFLNNFSVRYTGFTPTI